MPIQLDAKLNAFRRSTKGFFITLEINPDSDWEDLARAPLGTAFGIAMVAFDPETGKASVEPVKPERTPRERKPWNEMSRAQQAGILCGDTKFQLWLSTRKIEGANAADALRQYCNIPSRTCLDDPEYRAAARDFDVLVAAFRQDTGQFAEQRA